MKHTIRTTVVPPQLIGVHEDAVKIGATSFRLETFPTHVMASFTGGIGMNNIEESQEYVFCVQNDDCDDLEVRKVYQVIPDEKSKKKGMLRVIDESGEDYLYPSNYFILVELPKKAKETFIEQRVESIA